MNSIKTNEVEELDIDSSIEITGGDWFDNSLGVLTSLAIAGGVLAAPVAIGVAALVGAGLLAF